MSDQVTNYKCPACDGALHFDGKSGKLVCEYCDSAYTIEEIEALYADQNAKAEEAFAQTGQQTENAKEEKTGDEWEYTTDEWTDQGIKSFTCPSCGAELMMDETTAATSCPFCGNPTVVPGQFKGVLKPECIIPFKLDKKAAQEALKNHYTGKYFLPKAFSEENHIKEIKGVYVPFWLYNGKAHAQGSYEGRKIETKDTEKEKITITKHYDVERAGDISFEKIPADASSKMPDDLMDSIEPYNYNELIDFNMAYLPGYMADKYDVSAEDNAKRATERAKKSALSAMNQDIKGYDEISTKFEHVSVKQGKVSYAMMPVWLLSTKWNEKNYLFAMNGQTGKMVGDLPVDNTKFWTTFAGIAVITEILMALLTFVVFKGDIGIVDMLLRFVALPLGLAAIICFILKSSMKSVAKATQASDYVTEGGMTFTRRKDVFTHKTEKVEPKEQKN